ncbi:H-2 class II histocompatibility antigen, A-U alpha chain-like [Poecilia latipinna]|uniref:H-2 class II histocompatibility antigen, A-U alpha chain-like n=1 Tax=Poecilia latipinna TaxID=48699 RepID=A0A3B3VHY2_9TELE|nr:PREDICTED: H-2 class II histocompatibility antigen, A-U alpha chain-like [Poecilia latipinna]
MKHSALLVFILNSYFVFSQIPHEITYFVGCFVNGTIGIQSEFDGEEILYIDIQKKEIVFTVPPFIDTDPQQILGGLNILKDVVNNQKMCQILAESVITEMKPVSEEKDPPDSMIFPSREVEPGVENSLICFVNNFYPPSIKVSWTKNGVPVRRGVSVGDYSPNNDQTFRQFSTLTFTPSEGDIYSCTVEHPALETPKTRIWEVEFYNTDPSLGPDIYCGVGLGLGVIGITVGVFFIVKGQQAN